MNVIEMLKRMETDMNPYSLYPLTSQKSAVIDDPIGAEVSIAAYQAIDALVTGAARLAGPFTRWQKRRRAVAELSRLSDHMLRDIGIERGEIRDVVDGLLNAPKVRPAGRPHLVAANASAQPVLTAAANDNVTGIAA